MNASTHIRPIHQADNPAVARIIRQVMTEHGAVGCGFSIEDPEVDSMYEAYPAPRAEFFVVEHQGRVQGCGGMAPLIGGNPLICELRKMYFLPELRGLGMGARLLDRILLAARNAGFESCYLESLQNMHAAHTLYRRYGFEPISQALGATGHTGCNVFMMLALHPVGAPGV